jgi:hypothetical protein
LASAIAAGLTNSFEAITVAKQTDPSTDVKKMIREDWKKLLKRGLWPRMCYNGLQGVFFFYFILKVGKIFNVELSDD